MEITLDNPANDGLETICLGLELHPQALFLEGEGLKGVYFESKMSSPVKISDKTANLEGPFRMYALA